jgi:hypothetical protein
MQKTAALFFFVLLASVFLVVAPVGAADVKVILYQTDFSTDPGWITNNPSYYYWDVANGNYHFQTEGGTNGYSYVPVEINAGPFVLEYDLTITSMAPESAVRFGVTGTEMDISRGTVVLGNFDRNQYGQIMALQVIDPNNHLYEKTSRYDSYCGEQPNCYTREFAENTTYHVMIRYNDQVDQVDIKISEKNTGDLVWGYFVGISNDLHSINRLAITTKGDYSVGNPAVGSIDNVEFYTFRTVTPTPTTVPTTEPTTILPTTIPTTTPTPTPTKVPLGAAVIVGTLAIAGGLLAWMDRRKA